MRERSHARRQWSLRNVLWIPALAAARLMRSARPIEGLPYERGAGVLDIEAALAETGTTNYAPSPRVIRGEEEGSITAEETAALWGDELLLGD